MDFTVGGTIAYTEPIGKKVSLQIDYNPHGAKTMPISRLMI